MLLGLTNVFVPTLSPTPQAHVETRDFETGRWLADVQLPGIGSVTGFSGDHKATEFFLTFASFTEPGATFRQGGSGGGGQ